MLVNPPGRCGGNGAAVGFDNSKTLSPEAIRIMAGWTEGELVAVRTALEARRAELAEMGDRTRSDREPVQLDQSKVGRLSRMDALQVQAMAAEPQRRRETEAKRIDAALARIATGDYGYCVRCETPIPRERLRSNPAVPTCIACAG
jgi:DnaK suppressor protein